jgi:hypothetical protein
MSIRPESHLPNLATSLSSKLVALLPLILLAAGCGDGGERHFYSQIQGTVTCEGKGLESASISFEGGPAGTFGGPVEAGKYHFDNVAEGTYDVVIYPIIASSVKLDPKSRLAEPRRRTDIPSQYRSALTSGIKATITTGVNTFDVELEKEAL